MSNIQIRIAVTAVGGRMGRQLLQIVAQSDQVALGAAISRIGSGLCGRDAGDLTGIGPLGITITDDLEAVKDDFDILIDFSRPDSSLAYVNFCLRHHKGIVIGTTGFIDVQKEAIHAAAKETGIVFSSNFSIGATLMIKLLEKAAKIMGEEADIEIFDAHHSHKVDAPSGTALAMGEVIASALGRDLAHCAVYSREGHTGERKAKSIGFSTIRAGDIVGEHTVMFAQIGERLEITHKASSSMMFITGAIRAAVWLFGKQKGLFDMMHVLNMNKL